MATRKTNSDNPFASLLASAPASVDTIDKGRQGPKADTLLASLLSAFVTAKGMAFTIPNVDEQNTAKGGKRYIVGGVTVTEGDTMRGYITDAKVKGWAKVNGMRVLEQGPSANGYTIRLEKVGK